MAIGGTCYESEYSLCVQTGIARKPHVCRECGHPIEIGEPFSWAIWGLPGEGGGSARRCQFCASFADGYDCIAWGGLRDAIENADYEDLMALPVHTRDEILRRFGWTLEEFQS